MILAIIPARGGSKRIPHKNIKLFGGKPMIAWSIQAALDSKVFDEIVVSTDDKEIANIARKYGASVPFDRPEELSGDNIDTIPVVAHTIEWYCQNKKKPDLICCIYPTAPFISYKDIQKGIDVLKETGADYVFSVTSFPYPIQRAIKVLDDQRVEMFNPSCYKTRSQDLEKAYHDAGQFYWGKKKAWLSSIPLLGLQSAPILIPRHRVQDIDTQEDWDNAEVLLQALRSR